MRALSVSRGAVHLAQPRRDRRDALNRTFGQLDLIAHFGGPQAQRLQLVHQAPVHHQEVARERLTLEQVGHLRLDALVATGDRGDRRGRRDGDEQRVAQALGLDLLAQLGPATVEVGRRGGRPVVELHLAIGRTGFLEARQRTVALGDLVGHG